MAGFAVDVVLAATVLLVVIQPGTARPIGERGVRALASLAVALVAVAIASLGKSTEVWPGHPAFPSGHMTFVVSLGISVADRSRRWLTLMVGLWAAEGVCLVIAGFHTPVEVLGGVALGVALGLPGQRAASRLAERVAPGAVR